MTKNITNVTDNISDFNKIKHLIKVRLINKDRNVKLLEQIPYIPFLDMAIIATIEMDRGEGAIAAIKINNELLKTWNFTLSEIMPIANRNTFKGYDFKSMAEIISEMLGEPKEEYESKVPMYVLSNKSGINGATEICNYQTMKELAERFNSDLIVLPSSIHETIIIPKTDEMELNTLTEMVNEVNTNSVDAEEVLSDHAYIFNRETGWEY